MDDRRKEVWDFSLASSRMGFLLVCGITLLISALAWHIWSRLIWLICGGCFGAFFGFMMGKRSYGRSVPSNFLVGQPGDEDAENPGDTPSGPADSGLE